MRPPSVARAAVRAPRGPRGAHAPRPRTSRTHGRHPRTGIIARPHRRVRRRPRGSSGFIILTARRRHGPGRFHRRHRRRARDDQARHRRSIRFVIVAEEPGAPRGARGARVHPRPRSRLGHLERHPSRRLAHPWRRARVQGVQVRLTRQDRRGGRRARGMGYTVRRRSVRRGPRGFLLFVLRHDQSRVVAEEGDRRTLRTG